MSGRFGRALLVCGFAVLFAGSSARAETDPNGWNLGTSDRKIHYLASYGLTMTGVAYLTSKKVPLGTSILFSMLGTLAIGVAKEKFLDDPWSQGDIKANVLGIASGGLVSWVIHF